MARADLLVVNKIDLAPLVGADRVREGRPTILTSGRARPEISDITAWVRAQVGERAPVLG